MLEATERMRQLLPLLLLLASCEPGASPDALPVPAADTISKTGGSPTGSLFEREEHGTLTGADGIAYTLASGYHCDECGADRALYVYPSSSGLPPTDDGMNARMFPGILRDGETGEPYFESRAFFGEVLPGVPGVIWYERSLGVENVASAKTVLLDLSMGMQDSQQPGHDLLDRTLALAAAGKCTELAGVDRTTAP